MQKHDSFLFYAKKYGYIMQDCIYYLKGGQCYVKAYWSNIIVLIEVYVNMHICYIYSSYCVYYNMAFLGTV